MLEVNKNYYCYDHRGSEIYFQVKRKDVLNTGSNSLGYYVVRIDQSGKAISREYFVSKRIEHAAFDYFIETHRARHPLTNIFQ